MIDNFKKNRWNMGGVLLSLIAFGFIIAGLLSLWGILYVTWDDFEVQFFKKNECVIKYAEIRNKKDAGKIEVEYSYFFKGKEYYSSKYSNEKIKIKDYSEAQRVIDSLNADKLQFCYVNENIPQKSVIKKGFPYMFALAIFPLLFIFLGIACFRRSSKKINVTLSSSPKKMNTNSQVYLVFLIFVIIGIIIIYFVFWNPYLEMMDSHLLVESPCRIIHSELEELHSDDSVSYRINIIYEYNFKGKNYFSNRFTFLNFSSGNYKGKLKLIRKYKKGDNYICFVNPEDQYKSVLNREFSNSFYFAGIPLIFVLIGLFGIFVLFINGLKNKVKIKKHRKNFANPDDYDCINHNENEEIHLESEFSPILKICFISLFSLFWNGIISIFILEVFKGFQTGNPDWFLALFMVPFVIVGIGTIIGIIYFILSAFNPRPVLTIASKTIFQGDELNLKWHFKGDVNSLDRFKIYIEGIESASYRRGTSTYTDTSVFKTIDVIDTKFHGEMIEGSKRIQLPENIMPSFTAHNNKIIWKIKVEGIIPKWPDIENNYIIEIRCKNG